MTPDSQPPLYASAVLTWDGERVTAEPLPERYAARDSRCHRSADPLWEQSAPRYTYARSHRNLETRIADLDAALNREHQERPKQLSAHEVAERVHEAGRIVDDVLQRDPVLAAAIVVQAYVLWGQLPQDPRSTAREGPKARFGSVKAVLCAATARTAVLGVSGRSYAVAESRGRTRARWDEVDCKPSHGGGSRPRALGAVERELDAVVGLERAGLDAADVEGLCLWLVNPPTVETQRGRRIDWPTLLTRYRAVIGETELSDPALRERLRRAKRRLEERLRAIPEAAAELAGVVSAETRDELGLLRGLIPEAKKRTEEPRRACGRAVPVLRSEVV